MTDPKYKAFTALEPFFDIVQQGLTGQVDGEHYFDTIAENAVFFDIFSLDTHRRLIVAKH